MSDSYGAQNASPTVWTSTASIPGITNASQIIVHYGTLETESGEEMTTEDGEPIVLENEFTYNVRRAHADAFGVTYDGTLARLISILPASVTNPAAIQSNQRNAMKRIFALLIILSSIVLSQTQVTITAIDSITRPFNYTTYAANDGGERLHVHACSGSRIRTSSPRTIQVSS